MRVIFYLSLLTFGFAAQAQVTTQEVDLMLKQMVKEHVITEADAVKARIRMQAMNSKEWQDVNKKAMAKASRGPASVSNDLDKEQFKSIQEDLQKIAPQYKN